jgi:hypothetical protein
LDTNGCRPCTDYKTNCASCSKPGSAVECDSCILGYGVSSLHDCVACFPIDSHCRTCGIPISTFTCLSCNANYVWNDTKSRCDRVCTGGLKLDVTTNTCKSCNHIHYCTSCDS